jgi:plasmid stabilization system protein ParE
VFFSRPNYYKEKTSLRVAQKLVIGIVKETGKLKKQPKIGQEEGLLEGDIRGFRYLVFKSYKIIYWTNTEKNRIEIFDVFDTRQNPIKMKR